MVAPCQKLSRSKVRAHVKRNVFDKLTSQVQTAKRSFLFLEPKEYEYTYMYNSGFHYKHPPPAGDAPANGGRSTPSIGPKQGEK